MTFLGDVFHPMTFSGLMEGTTQSKMRWSLEEFCGMTDISSLDVRLRIEFSCWMSIARMHPRSGGDRGVVYQQVNTTIFPSESAPSPNSWVASDSGPTLKPDTTSKYSQYLSGSTIAKSATLPKARRHIHWTTPTIAFLLTVVGIAAAIGHHLHLSKLNGNPNENAKWIGRYSLALAFLVKASLAGAIGIAFMQKAWQSLAASDKGSTVASVDSLFGVQLQPLNLLTPGMWRSAFIASVLSLVLWLMPLVALISPTTLSVAVAIQVTGQKGCVVHGLNLSVTDFSLGLRIFSTSGTSLIPSDDARRIASIVSMTGDRVLWESPCGANCSYEVTFNAPAWRCFEVEDANNATAGWATNLRVVGEELVVLHDDASATGHYYANVTDLTGRFWMVYSNFNSTNITAFYCEDWNTKYSLQVNYVNSQQSVIIEDLEYLNEVSMSSTARLNAYTDLGTGKVYTPTLASYMTLVALYLPITDLMTGWDSQTTWLFNMSQKSSLPLMPRLTTRERDGNYIPVWNLPSLIEEMSRNLSISLLAEPGLVYATNETTTCHKTTAGNVWHYEPMPLITAYSIGVGATIIALVIGGIALLSNEQAHDMSFSAILRTTRSLTLDTVVEGAENGALPVPKTLGQSRLKLVRDATGGEAFKPIAWVQ